MTKILQASLPIKPWMSEPTRRLPGIQPLAITDWLIRDDVYDAQMAYRDQLLQSKTDKVYVFDEQAKSASQELFAVIQSNLDGDYTVEMDNIMRPDGVTIALSEDSLMDAARLVQEDLLIMQEIAGEYVLTAGVLCFPASWSLRCKFMCSLDIIHKPVDPYDDNIGNRVNRMFAAMRPEQPLWRANYLLYRDADLHQPHKKNESNSIADRRFVRVERQTLRKLPETKAVVFGIHTYVVPIEMLTESERSSLIQHVSA